MTEYTEGPWKVEVDPDPSTATIFAGAMPVCTTSYASSEDKANAQLIAAAPDLVMALNEMATQHYCGCGHPACNECKRDRMCAHALHEAGFDAPEDWR